MSQTQPPPSEATPAQRDLPALAIILVILLCLGGGGAFVWWFFAASPAPTTEVRLKEGEPVQPAAPERRPRPRGRNRDQVPPLQVAEAPAGTRVTAKWAAVPLAQVLRELPKPASTSIVVSDDAVRSRPVTLDAQDLPFWAALRAINEQTRTTLSRQHGNRTEIQVRNLSGAVQPPAVVTGPFMVTLSRISQSGTINLASGSTSRSVSLTLQLAAEPKSVPTLLGIIREVTIEEAVDQAGRSLLRTGGGRSYSDALQFQESWQVDLHASLNSTPESTRLATVRGYITILVAESTQPFEIQTPLQQRNVSTTIDGIRIRFKELRDRGNNWEALFEADGSYYDPAILHRFTGDDNRMQLVDDRNRRFDTNGGGWGGGNDTFPFNRDFSKAGSRVPAKLILQVPTGVKAIRVPFAFTDLPLPS